jgi:hypothetical protein
VLSPLLANVALHVLDEAWEQTSSGLGMLVRYADDLVVLCTTRARAEAAQQRVAAIIRPLGLQLHPDKTRIVCLIHGQQGFDFLGFHHHKVESWRWRGKYYLNRWPSDRAMNSIRARIREATGRDKMGASVDWVVVRLNLVLRGWAAYFRGGSSSRKFATIDSYVHERLAIFDSAKHGRTGRNWRRHDRAWLERPGNLPSQPSDDDGHSACLPVNDVGKPCAGKPHARFDRGLLAKQRPWWVGTHAPDGKPAGVSPTACRLLINQQPTLPVALSGLWVPLDVGSNHRQGRESPVANLC